MSDNKYLKLARVAREENNSEDAKRFYDMVRVEDPENGEAKFFFQYFALYEGANKDIASRFAKLVNALESSVKLVAASADSDEEKIAAVTAIAHAFVPMTWSLNRYMNKLTVGSGSDKQRVLSNTDIMSAGTNGMKGLYHLGDVIEKTFGDNAATMALAVESWKEAISLHQKWYAYKIDGKKAEEIVPVYAEKIKKIDPAYEVPKKAGCISFSDKKN